MTDKRRTGRPKSEDPAVTVSFSLPRTVAAEVDAAIASSRSVSRSAWFRDAVLRKMGHTITTEAPPGRDQVTPRPKKATKR